MKSPHKSVTLFKTVNKNRTESDKKYNYFFNMLRFTVSSCVAGIQETKEGVG